MGKVISFKWIPLGSVLITCLFLSAGYLRVQSSLSLPTYTSTFKQTDQALSTTWSSSNSSLDTQLPSHRIHVALTPHTSILGQRIFTLGYEGKVPLPIIHDLIDQAVSAVYDGLVHGSISLSASPTPTPHSFPLGSTTVEWVSRGAERVLSLQDLSMILKKEKPLWPNGQPFQFAFRASPSVLENAWFKQNPSFEHQLKQSKLYQESPRFYSEETLIKFLKNTPGAVALMEKARMRLLGIPVRSIQIEKTQPVQVYLTFDHLHSDQVSLRDHYQTQLLFWLDFLKGDELKSGLNEWGWETSW